MQLQVIVYFSDPAPLQYPDEVLLADDHHLEFEHDNPTLGGEEIYPAPPTYNINTTEPELDDIKIEYHPRSGRPPQFFHFGDYTTDLPEMDIPIDPEPWKPFRSRLDFELAELILDTHMNKAQTNALISIIHRCVLEPHSFTLKNEGDLARIWENASTRATKVSH
jgi:hypothetical protein